MKFKKTLNTLALTVVSTTIFTTNVFALTFSDVPNNYWGYSAIDSVSNKGFMVGDLNGNFRPNSYIDRFETSIVLARLLGYKSTGATAEETAYYDACYNNQISLIQQYDDKFSKWAGYANREIAFLLEKGVITNADLNQFVILSTAGAESINPLTREDMAVFLVRALGAVDTANSQQYTNMFNDDANIQSSKKSSVYYLRTIGIVNGDTNNNYNPKNPIRRAEMATLLDKTYNYLNGGTTNTDTTTNPTPDVTTVTTVTGTIDTYYDNLDTVAITTTSGQAGIYVLDGNCTITIDGVAKTKSELKQGMYCVLVVEGGKTVKDIKATSNTSTPTVTTPTAPTTPTGTTVNVVLDANIPQVNGTVATIDVNNSTIGISTKTISPKGDIVTTVNTYTVTSGTPMAKNNKAITLANIAVNDIITCNVNGQYVSNIIIEQKEQTTEGTILDKGYDTTTARYYFVIDADNSDENVKVFVTTDSKITRGGATTSWGGVKVGDTVSCTATFGIIDTLSALGSTSTDTGYVKEVYINKNSGYVIVTDSDGNDERKYALSPNIENAYNLKIGSKAKFKLDSNEINSITILMEPQLEPINGTVQNIYRDRITVINSVSGVQTIYYDDDTKFINSNTGSFTTLSNVDTGDQIYAVYSVADTSNATTITVVNK